RSDRDWSSDVCSSDLNRHLVEKVPVSNLCDELDIAPNLFYRWQQEFFENGHAAFDNGRKAKSVEDGNERKIEKLEAKLQRKDSEIGRASCREREEISV